MLIIFIIVAVFTTAAIRLQPVSPRRWLTWLVSGFPAAFAVICRLSTPTWFQFGMLTAIVWALLGALVVWRLQPPHHRRTLTLTAGALPAAMLLPFWQSSLWTPVLSWIAIAIAIITAMAMWADPKLDKWSELLHAVLFGLTTLTATNVVIDNFGGLDPRVIVVVVIIGIAGVIVFQTIKNRQPADSSTT